jgi:hypothetical protein
MHIQLKITLQGSKPPIWRRVLVSDKSTLLDLHDLIQYCFDWKDYHLHMFQVSHMEFVSVEDWEEDGNLYQDDSMACLGDLIPKFIPEGGKFTYRYDYGDNWELKIFVEKIIPKDEDSKTPRILAGKRAGPPEDVGGVWGYDSFLEAMRDPHHPEHDSYQTWIGGSFDPEVFDIDDANRTLTQTLRRRNLIRQSTWPIGPLYGNFLGMTQNTWTESLSKELRAAAVDLPLRRDMVTLLSYLAENKVKGTKARGNFPRKHIRAITANFVDPPRLDTEIGNTVWKLQSEDEVQELLRYHLLACIAGLIFGGENLPWEVLPQGEVFLSLPPVSQVWYLARIWFRGYNWVFEYDVPNNWSLFNFKATTVKCLSSYPIEQDIPIDHVIRDLTTPQVSDFSKDHLYYFLANVIFKPLTTFGIIKAIESNPEDEFFSKIISVQVPKLGHQILEEQKTYFRLGK